MPDSYLENALRKSAPLPCFGGSHLSYQWSVANSDK